jgi:hypothetical protein
LISRPKRLANRIGIGRTPCKGSSCLPRAK